MTTTGNYIVLARKYRPKILSDLIGQDDITKIIKGSIKLNRVAHAFLFSGTRGVGKTSVARILAKIVNCQSSSAEVLDPCLKCETCTSIDNETNMDVVEIDAASRTGVSDVREIIENINYKPMSAKKKIYIIDEVHMLSKAAFNALLKTLEEPPSDVLFIFATTEIEKIPVTILSRCQRFILKRVGMEELSKHLINVANKEGFQLDFESSNLIAQSSEGSVRDALSILDNVIVRDKPININLVREVLGLSDNNLVVDLFENLFAGDVKLCLKKFDEIYEKGISIDLLAKNLMRLSYHLARIKALLDIENSFSDKMTMQRLHKISNEYEMDFIIRFWELINKYINEVSNVFDEKQCFEMIIIRLCYFSFIPTPLEGIHKFKSDQEIEKKVKNSENKMMNTENFKTNQNVVTKSNILKKPENNNYKNNSLSADSLGKFSYLVSLIEEKSELIVSYHLKNSFRLINLVEPNKNKNIGTIELQNIAKDINEKLILWKASKILLNITGNRWIISISNNSGLNSLAEIEEKEENKKIQQIKNDKFIKKFLEMIPSSEVTSIRENKEEQKFKNKGKK